MISFEKYFDIKPFVMMFTKKAYLSACFGSFVDQSLKDRLANAFDKLFVANKTHRSLIAQIYRKCDHFMTGKSVDIRVIGEIGTIVDEILRKRKTNSCKNSLLFMLSDANRDIDKNQRLTNKQIIDSVIMIAIIGYQTSVVSILHLIHCLAINQGVQQKLIKEIDKYFDNNNNDDKNDVITNNVKTNNKKNDNNISDDNDEGQGVTDKIESMPYLDACINETIRQYPPVSLIKRRVIKELTLDCLNLPKDCHLMIPVLAMHKSADNYAEPNQFKPDRFLQHNKSTKLEYSPWS
ncbi:cytochrome P450 3A6-like [Oppia nitens]|uniref:cytochrome P450 3A6-like n=1 Tax=Oppia nitens TaxID=1686743 RepID=UPI0023D9FADA|nr:cytochrome P450 3A6-like [Oppia nitens]